MASRNCFARVSEEAPYLHHGAAPVRDVVAAWNRPKCCGTEALDPATRPGYPGGSHNVAVRTQTMSLLVHNSATRLAHIVGHGNGHGSMHNLHACDVHAHQGTTWAAVAAAVAHTRMDAAPPTQVPRLQKCHSEHPQAWPSRA